MIDSTSGLTADINTEAGTENCFTVAGVDKYGSVGTKSEAACDKSQFSPPDSIVVTNDKRNNNLIEWSAVEGASSYNLYANGKTPDEHNQNRDQSKKFKMGYRLFILPNIIDRRWC